MSFGRRKKLARVELGSEYYAGIAHFDDRPTVPLAICKLSDANALEVLSAVKAELENLEKNFPEGMEWTLGYDSTNFVRVTMEEIVMTLVMTFILVVAITWLFLQDWRATIVPSVTIPVSLIGTFIFLDLLGMSINTLSMFALILVIGSVVDDAVCVTESCVRMIQEEHLSPFDAAMKTMQQLTGALTPGCIFTSPEIGTIGKSEEQLKSEGVAYSVGKFPFAALGKAMAMNQTEGFVKILADAESDQVLGIHIIGPHATDLIAEAGPAMLMEITAKELGRAIHAHPTLGEAMMEAAHAVHGECAHMPTRKKR